MVAFITAAVAAGSAVMVVDVAVAWLCKKVAIDSTVDNALEPRKNLQKGTTILLEPCLGVLVLEPPCWNPAGTVRH